MIISNEKLRDCISHRLRFTYEDGTSVTGYLAACRPAQGPVRVLVLTRAEIMDDKGQLVEQHRELLLIPSVLSHYQVAEGPSASHTR